MTQLLPPASAEVFSQFRSSSSSFRCSGDGWRGSAVHRRFRIDRCSFSRRYSRSTSLITASVTKDTFSEEDLTEDYYAVLGLLPDATPNEIKKAYCSCMKVCHPDLNGNVSEATNLCMFINDVYAVLSDPVQRMVYDEIHGYAATAINPFLDDTVPKDHVFVDEFSCIGCKNCANVASDVFKIEEDFGRARACSQSGNSSLVQEAIDSCPVDCIHWTSATQHSLLEDEMRRIERVNVGLMLSGMGGASADVFVMARRRWERHQEDVLEKTKLWMMKRRGSDKSGSWSNLWGNLYEYRNKEEVTEIAKKAAAAAARRWQEYSRRGADRFSTIELPETRSNSE